ncbi:MAG: hypothetical protein ACRDP5_17690 [Streptosporangiaceae bacterium]
MAPVLIRFTPTRRFWSVAWVRDRGRIVGVSIATAHRAWAVFRDRP